MEQNEKNTGKITIYYFSGTGNTRVIAERIAARFNAGHHYAVVKKMEDVKTVTVEPDEIVGIGFPIASFSTYPVVFSFLNKLPEVSGNGIFGFCTMGGASLYGIIDEVRKRCMEKGYTPRGFMEFRMPVNIFYQMSVESCRNKVERAFSEADTFADTLVTMHSKWDNRLPGSKLFFLLADGLFRLTEKKLHQKLLKIRVDNEKCVRCGICMRKCPVGNITMDGGIRIGDRCQYCLRCVAVCPHDANFAILSPKSMHYRVEQVLSSMEGNRQ